MVKWYLLQIQMNRMTLEEVPKRWHDTVAEALKQKNS